MVVCSTSKYFNIVPEHCNNINGNINTNFKCKQIIGDRPSRADSKKKHFCENVVSSLTPSLLAIFIVQCPLYYADQLSLHTTIVIYMRPQSTNECYSLKTHRFVYISPPIIPVLTCSCRYVVHINPIVMFVTTKFNFQGIAMYTYHSMRIFYVIDYLSLNSIRQKS